MAEKDYSHRTLIDKLNIREGARVLASRVSDVALIDGIRVRTSDCSVSGRKKTVT